MEQLPPLSPSDFVAILNATMEYAYPRVQIEGELANFRISKNKWVYFDIKDEEASVKFFGTVFNLPGPLEEGMLLRITGTPRLHPLYGFSVTVQSIELSGEGTIKKAFSLLQAKLEAEGLFDESRKRLLPYPPKRVGLITSGQSAAYADFIKILKARWGGVQVELADVQVQGEAAPSQIAKALEHFNAAGEPPDVIVLIRGGGSPDDLQAFNTELVTRSIAASRIPTLAAIGHEIDLSLAELAADVRASTPSNAAELLVPDKTSALIEIGTYRDELERLTLISIRSSRQELALYSENLTSEIQSHIKHKLEWLKQTTQILEIINPMHILSRGYAVIRKNGIILRSVKDIQKGDSIEVRVSDGSFGAKIN